jgi:hypothetical protein
MIPTTSPPSTTTTHSGIAVLELAQHAVHPGIWRHHLIGERDP